MEAGTIIGGRYQLVDRVDGQVAVIAPAIERAGLAAGTGKEC